jgi:hypothetical protein
MKSWDKLLIELPLPPSANDLWIPARGRIVSSPALRDFTKVAHRHLRALAEEHALQPITGPVRVIGTYWLETLASDGPNRDKALFDVLQGYVYENDRQVGCWEMQRVFCSDDGLPPRVEFSVTEILHPELSKRLDSARVRAARRGVKSARVTVAEYR